MRVIDPSSSWYSHYGDHSVANDNSMKFVLRHRKNGRKIWRRCKLLYFDKQLFCFIDYTGISLWLILFNSQLLKNMPWPMMNLAEKTKLITSTFSWSIIWLRQRSVSSVLTCCVVKVSPPLLDEVTSFPKRDSLPLFIREISEALLDSLYISNRPFKTSVLNSDVI